MPASESHSAPERSLTPKQERFIEEYIIDLNGTQAAIRAGYSPSTAVEQASRLLKNVKVAVKVSQERALKVAHAGVTADMVREGLRKIAMADPRKAMKWGSRYLRPAATDEFVGEVAEQALYVTDVELIPSDELDDDTAFAISEVTMTANGPRIKFHDKRAALVDLGKDLGLFKDRVELSGRVEVTAIKRTIVDPKA